MRRALGLGLCLRNMKKIDANVFLRYVLDDHAEMSPKAREIIDRHIVEIPVEVLCEVVYVLKFERSINSTVYTCPAAHSKAGYNPGSAPLCCVP